MAFKIASAFVDIGMPLGGVKGSLGKMKGMLSAGIGMAFKAAAMAAAAGVAAIGAALAGAIWLVKLGSNLEEMRAKFGTVFGKLEDDAREFSKNFAEGVGRSQIAIEGMMAGLQDLFIPMGFAGEQALSLSKTVTNLGVDLASFNQGMSDEEATQRLQDGILGSHEVLKKFGVVINENILSEKLRAMGLAESSLKATEQAKILARLQIIMESTTAAQGDASRTSGSLKNQWKALTGQLYDLGSTVGLALIPAAQGVIAAFGGITDWFNTNMETVTGFTTMLGDAFTSVFDYLEGIIARFVALFQAQWDVMGEYYMGVWNVLKVVTVGVIGAIIEYIMGYIEFIGQLVRTIWQFTGLSNVAFSKMGGTVSGVFTKIKDFAISAFGTIKEWISTVVFTMLNMDLVTKKLGIKMAETFTNMALNVGNFATNVVELFRWIGENWQDIIFSAVDGMLTMIINLGKNIRAVFAAIWEAIKTRSINPLDNIDFTPILEGAVSTISNMPAFVPYIKTDLFDDQLDEVDAEWGKRTEKWNQLMADNAPKIADAIEEGIEEAEVAFVPEFNIDDFDIEGELKKKEKKKKDDTGSFSGLASIWKDMNKAIMGDDLEKKGIDLQEDQLAETKKSNEILQGLKDEKALVAMFQ